MAASDRAAPPSLPSSSALPKIRISQGSSRFTTSPTPESPRTPNLDRTQAVREESLARSGSNSSSRSATSNLPTGVRTTPTRATPRTRSPPPPISSHAGGILPPTSFFRVGQSRSTPPRPLGNGHSMSMPYGPSRPNSQQPQSHLAIKPPAMLPIASPPTSPRSGTFGDSDSEAIPMGAIVSGPQSSGRDSSFAGRSMDESQYSNPATDSPSAGYSVPQAYRTKASRDPLLPQKNTAPDSMRSVGTEGSVRGGLAGVFARHSVDSYRNSSDLEQGMRQVKPLEPTQTYISPATANANAPPGGQTLTRSSSIAGSEDRAMTYHTLGNTSTADMHQSKLSPVIRDEPKATIHPHPIIIPAAPVLDEKTGKPLRNHALIPSKNVFFLRGKALTGGDTPLPFIATLTVIFGIAAVWFSCTAPWWWHNVSIAIPIVAAYMTLFCLASLLMTAFRDPGILPRNLDIDPPMAQMDDDGPPVPLPRDLRVRAGVVRVKYCPSCKIYRPPRSSHCRLCDNCVDSCDHHCQWVNNCVGRRNYTHFFTFLIAVSLTDIFITVTTALHIYLVAHRDHLSFHHALSKTVGSAVCFIISLLTIWPVLTLLGYHCRLIVLNITTIEQVRSQARNTLAPADETSNPFTLGRWTRNVAYLFCRPSGYSWIQADEVAMDDRRVVNPGARSHWKSQDNGLYGHP